MVNSLKTKLSSLNKTIIIGTIVTILINVQASASYQADIVPALDVSKIKKQVDIRAEKKLYTYIKTINPGVKDIDAAKMAVQFIKEKKEFPKVPTRILVSSINTESTFDKNVKHDIKAVIGLGGIYTKYWLKPLKEAGIIKNANDLKKPEVNIRATAFVLNHFIEKYDGNLKKALTAYKGISRVGSKRASVVLAKASILKKEHNI